MRSIRKDHSMRYGRVRDLFYPSWRIKHEHAYCVHGQFIGLGHGYKSCRTCTFFRRRVVFSVFLGLFVFVCVLLLSSWMHGII